MQFARARRNGAPLRRQETSNIDGASARVPGLPNSAVRVDHSGRGFGDVVQQRR